MSQKDGVASLLRLTLAPLRVFFVLPQVVQENGRVATSKLQKAAAAAVLILLTLPGSYIHFRVRPAESLRNGYTLFSFARASITTVCTYFNIGTSLVKSDATVTLLNHLIRLQDRVELTKKDVTRLRTIVYIELVFTFLIWSVVLCNTDASADGGLLTVALAVTTRHIAIASFVSEIMFVNSCIIIRKYIDRFHDEIRAAISEVGRSRATATTVEKVRTMKSLYWEIYQSKMEMQKAYSFTLLTVVSNCLIDFIFFVFVNIIKFQHGESLPPRKNLFVVTFVPVVFLRLYFLTTVCEGLKNKMKKTPVLTTRLWSVVGDRRARNMLSTFLKDISSMDPTITCSGFAVIDAKLFNAMIANIFMYVVMLLQFEFPDYGSNPLDNLLFYC